MVCRPRPNHLAWAKCSSRKRFMSPCVTPPDPLGLTRHPTCHPQTGCVRSAAQYTPTHHPSPSIHTGWVVASGNRTPNLTFNTSGSPADATSCAAAQLVASAGEPEVLKVRLGVRFPLATTHPVWMDGEGWGVGVHWAVVTWEPLGPEEG